jgi:hypothetical protein
VSGARAERFVVFNLRLMAASFFAVGVLFLAAPDSVLDSITDLGDTIGSFSAAPDSAERLWLGLGFAYMMVIAGICALAQMDVVRYRPLLLLLALAKAASSLSAFGFFVFHDDVFAYLLNFVVDGLLVLAALWLWSLIGRVGEPAAPS